MSATTEKDADGKMPTLGKHPPRPRRLLRIGVTGHRMNRIAEADRGGVAGQIDAVFASLESALGALPDPGGDVYDGDPALRLVTALAEGADRMAAQAALARKHEIQVVLPLDRDEYVKDFADPESSAAFRDLLSRATAVYEVTEFDGEAGAREKAYETAGLLTLRQSDILLAVWDGAPAHGRGGTADIVAQAVRSGIPVVWVDPDGRHKPRLLWRPEETSGSGPFDPQAVPAEAFAARADMVVRTLLAPPAAGRASHAGLARFFEETAPRWNLRLAYPVLLFLFGIRAIGRNDIFRSFDDRTARAGWDAYLRTLASTGGFACDSISSTLLHRYFWADRLATRYAQFFRSGYVANFILSALAVAMALMGLLAKDLKAVWIGIELVLIALILLNTVYGNRRRWHERWLDYRHLAEELRHLRFLSLVSAQVRPRPSFDDPTSEDSWIEWYAAATQREIGLPSATVGRAYVDAIGAVLRDLELREQKDYHRQNESAMHRLHHRLHLAGLVFFTATAIACIAFLVYYIWNHDGATALALPTTFVTALLPTIGAALYGIRVQGDFDGIASRSRAMAARLDSIQASLREQQDPGLQDMSRLAELSSDALLAEVAVWRLVFRTRPLELPG
jgi:hypothetical protein